MATFPHTLTAEDRSKGGQVTAERLSNHAKKAPTPQSIVNSALRTLYRALNYPSAKISVTQLRAAQIVMSTLVNRVQLDNKGDGKGDRLLKAIEKLETGAVPPVENGPAIAPPASGGPSEEVLQPIDSKGDSSSPGTGAEE